MAQPKLLWLLILFCVWYFPWTECKRSGKKNKRIKGDGTAHDRQIDGVRFESTVYTSDIREDVPVGSVVATVHAVSRSVDKEITSSIQYTLRKRKVDQYLNVPFRINPKTGDIFTIVALDVNRAGKYILLSYAYAKKGSRKLKATTRVFFNIIPVRVPLSNLQTTKTINGYIEENIQGPLNVSVPLPKTKNSGGLQVFIPTSTPSFAASIFRVNGRTGEVSTIERLDREERDVYELLIRIVHKERTIDIRYIVHVLDVNDNPPRFYHHIANFYIYENTDCLLPLNATDSDIGDNAIVSYRIAWGGSRYFEIDPVSGVLSNVRQIDYERTTRIELVVHAYSGNLFSYTQVVVYVRDLNDNPPILEDFQVFYNGLPESLSGAEVVQVPAHDIDVIGDLTYGIIPANDGNDNVLVMDAKTGIISVDPDLDPGGQHVRSTVTVWVTDGVHGAQAMCRVEITTVSIEMLTNGVSVRIPGLTEDSFLRTSGLNTLRRSLARSLRTKVRNLMIFNVQEGASEGVPLLNITFAAKSSENDSFIAPDNIINTIYFERKTLKTTSGLTIVPAEMDVCVAETCKGYEKCKFRKVYSDVNSAYANTNGRSVTFRGILPAIEQWCECPEAYRINNCSDVVDYCESEPCMNGGRCEPYDGGYSCLCSHSFTGDNCEIDFHKDSCFDGACFHGGTCIELDNGNGFTCTCPDGYEGSQCEMTSRFFPSGAYMAFPTLQQRTTMKISLNFSTSVENGLLMYVARYSQLHDFFAIELVDGQVAFSFSVGHLIMRVLVGSPEGISDRKWHLVELYYRRKVVEVTLDSCKWDEEIPENIDDEDEDIGVVDSDDFHNLPCVAYATQAVDVKAWFVDVNTPLIVGSLPETQEETRILNRNFIGCIKDIRIDNKILDFANAIIDGGTEPGCRWAGDGEHSTEAP